MVLELDGKVIGCNLMEVGLIFIGVFDKLMVIFL